MQSPFHHLESGDAALAGYAVGLRGRRQMQSPSSIPFVSRKGTHSLSQQLGLIQHCKSRTTAQTSRDCGARSPISSWKRFISHPGRTGGEAGLQVGFGRPLATPPRQRPASHHLEFFLCDSGSGPTPNPRLVPS